MALKPKMTVEELARYLLGACGKVIAQGYRCEKCICYANKFVVIELVPLRGGNEFWTRP